jgi:hypothetical protein
MQDRACVASVQIFERVAFVALQDASTDASGFQRSCIVAFTEHNQVVIGQHDNFHILQPQPRCYQPTSQVHVPDGGSGWAFVLAAFAIIGMAVIKRYSEKISFQHTA